MEFLIILGANIQILPDIAHIANDYHLHALMIEHGNQMGGLLMLDILDLMFDFPELPLFGSRELLAPT